MEACTLFLYFKFPITWGELFKRTGRKIIADNCVDLAAVLGFYFFLALFPALLFIVSLLAYLPLLDRLGEIAPPSVVTIIHQQLQSLSGNGSLLTIGILGTIWSSSSAISALIDTLNTAYDIKESRPWWKTRLIAIALTIGLVFLLFIAFSLILVGPQVVRWLDQFLNIGPALIALWKIIRWPVAFLCAIFAVDLVYYFGPDADCIWVWITPGSLTATILFIVSSYGFRAYIINFGSYNATYGAIGSVIVLLLWFYFSGLSLLIGAELDSAIDQATGGDLKIIPPGRRAIIGAARTCSDSKRK
jgi:membrane protein